MLRTLLYDPQNQSLQTGDEALIDRWAEEPATLLWLDLAGEDPVAEQRLLSERFGIHDLAIHDAQRERHPPKIERFETYTFVLFKALRDDVADVVCHTYQLALFVSERCLITRRARASAQVDQVWSKVQTDAGLFDTGCGNLALQLSNQVVRRYLETILSMEAPLETLEDRMFERPDDELLERLIAYKSELKKLRRIFLYHEQLLKSVTQEATPGIPPQLVHEARDVYEHQERAGSLAALYYELAGDLIDGYLSIASHKLNQIMKVLTIVTVIFVPLGLIAGIYGMNFDHMPELHTRFGYFGVLTLMALVVATLLFVFRRTRWL
jgi:magnesium transporter